MTLLHFKNLNFTSCITLCDIFHTNNPAFHKKNTKKIDFKYSFLKLLRKMIKIFLKMWKLKITPGVFCLNFLSLNLAHKNQTAAVAVTGYLKLFFTNPACLLRWFLPNSMNHIHTMLINHQQQSSCCQT